MKRPLRTIALSLLLAMKVCLLLSSPAPGSGSPDFNNPTLTHTFNPYFVFSFTDNSNEDDHYVVYRSDEDGSITHITDLPGDSPGQVQQFDGFNERGGYYYTFYVDAVLSNGTTLSRVAEVTFMMPLEGAVFSDGSPSWEVCGSEILVEFIRIDEAPNTATEIYRSTSSGSGFALVTTTTDQYYQDDVAPRKTYYYKLRTKRDGQVSPFSAVKSYTVGDDYYAPQFTAATVTNGIQVTLVDKTYHEDYYRILKIGPDDVSVLKENFSLPDSGSTFTIVDTAVVAGERYTYELYAKAREYCDSKSWPWDLEASAVITVTAPSTVALDAPVLHMDSPSEETCGSEAYIEYDRVDRSPGTSTEIYRSSSASSGFVLVTSTTNDYYLDDIAPRRTYYYKIRNVRGSLVSPFTPVKSVTVESDYYNPLFTATPVANGVKVTLSDRTYYEDYYYVVRQGSDGDYLLTDHLTLADSGSSYTVIDTTAIPGHSYTYELFAKALHYCDKYSWPWDLERSAYVDVTVPSNEPLAAPVMTMEDPADETCGSEVIIEFDRENIPGVTTQIFRSTSPSSGFVQVGSTTTNYYFDDVAPRKTYYYKVRNARGEQVSDFSEVKSVAVESDYYDPGFSVTLGDGGVVTLKLKDNTYADEYYHIEKYGEEGEVLFNELVMADSGRTFVFIDTLPTNLVETRSYTYLMTVVAVRSCDKYSWPRAEERGNVEITIPGTGVCPGAGSITRDFWANVSGAAIADIPLNTTPTSSSEITTFETPNYAGNNYAARIRGYVCVPQTGMYTFWLASDDQGVLYLSTDESPANKQQIARVDKAVKFREYTKYAAQRSAQVYLAAGERYYIEALHKEANGSDHISVRWQMPDGTMEAPIQGSHLIPYEEEPNVLPTVVITWPSDNYTEEAATGTNIEAEASDTDGTIAKVEFYVNGSKIGEDANAPYEINWQHPVQGTYHLAAVAYDNRNGVASDTMTYYVDYPDCAGAGYIEQEVWENIEGTEIASIPTNTRSNYSNSYIEFEAYRREGNNYGSRMRANLCLPATGNYTFWIAADDKAELWLSTDADPANKRLIASVNRATNYREYNKYASQKSVSIYLQQGVNYYIEALHKEGTGDDHLSVGWQLPDGTLQRPIHGHHLITIYPGAGTRATALNDMEENVMLSNGESDDISVYPNPVSSERKVSIKGNFGGNGPSRLQILSLNGVVVHDQEVSLADSGEINIDLASNITAGIYAVQVLQGRKRKVVKLVVK